MRKVFSIILFFVALVPAPALLAQSADPAGKDIDAVFDKLSRDMMCLCGCNSILKSCPHVECGYAIPARKRIRAMLHDGKTYDQVIARFVSEQGEKVLSAPTKKGFNLVAYVMPFIALLFAGSGVAVIASRWAKAARAGGSAADNQGGNAPQTSSGKIGDTALLEKLRKELEDFEG